MVAGSSTVTDLSHIAESLRPLAVPLDTLVPDPNNARTHGKKNLDAIRASLMKFGQVKPLAVRRSDMTVIAGNGRLSVAKSLGWSHVAVVLMDGTNEELAAFALADNKTAELGEWDEGALSDLMRVAATEIDLSALGFNDGELAKLLDAETVEPPEMPATPVETKDAPAPAPTPKAARAPEPAPKEAPAQQPVATTRDTITDEQWATVQEAAASVREEYDDPEMELGRCLRVLARRYLKSRVLV